MLSPLALKGGEKRLAKSYRCIYLVLLPSSFLSMINALLFDVLIVMREKRKLTN